MEEKQISEILLCELKNGMKNSGNYLQLFEYLVKGIINKHAAQYFLIIFFSFHFWFLKTLFIVDASFNFYFLHKYKLSQISKCHQPFFVSFFLLLFFKQYSELMHLLIINFDTNKSFHKFSNVINYFFL